MALGHCPECAELGGISPTGEVIGTTGTARYWRVDVHPDRRQVVCAVCCVIAPCDEHGWPICAGSGARI